MRARARWLPGLKPGSHRQWPPTRVRRWKTLQLQQTSLEFSIKTGRAKATFNYREIAKRNSTEYLSSRCRVESWSSFVGGGGRGRIVSAGGRWAERSRAPRVGLETLENCREWPVDRSWRKLDFNCETGHCQFPGTTARVRAGEQAAKLCGNSCRRRTHGWIGIGKGGKSKIERLELKLTVSALDFARVRSRFLLLKSRSISIELTFFLSDFNLNHQTGNFSFIWQALARNRS